MARYRPEADVAGRPLGRLLSVASANSCQVAASCNVFAMRPLGHDKPEDRVEETNHTAAAAVQQIR